METLMLLTYAALCIVVFKVFRIPLNKWTVPTAVLGGIALIGAVIFGMNYNFPYTDVGNCSAAIFFAPKIKKNCTDHNRAIA
ncbi:hypothetical protein HPN51_17855 [Klebsiella pneumoniae]|nr:hypothetical protein [Klebsiella pneumoniae]